MVWDYRTARDVCLGLQKHNAYWLEEPFDGNDLESPARLAAEIDMYITGGELGKTVFHFNNFLKNKTYDIIQPDTRICGGIWIAKKISVLAESYGVPCIQHGNASLGLAGYIQPAVKLLKTPQPWKIENGHILLPDLPGLGLDLNEDAIREYRRAQLESPHRRL
jgi:L-alanine-DL-glutamate epimerase-like enolase superfamily enzyme